MDHIRPATLDDLVTLTAIAHAAKRHWGYPEAVIASWRPLLTIMPDDLAVHAFFVAIEGTTLLGFGALDRGVPIATLEHLWVDPAAMQRGVGTALFGYAVDLARKHGAQRLRIEADPFAEPFYVRMGAVCTGSIATPIEGQPERVIPVLELALEGFSRPL